MLLKLIQIKTIKNIICSNSLSIDILLKSLFKMPSTIHRFTPPTCTLEIIGQKSPLSRWTNNDVLKKVRFKLRFDDPRQTTARQVTIEGSQEDLLLLQTVINNYVQTQLHNSLKLVENNPFISDDTRVDKQLPDLKPQGLMHHELFFGSLAHDSDRQKLKLGTVQLFDLVTALEAYQTKFATLPDVNSASAQKVIPLWGKIAAVAIATASIATVTAVLKPQPQQIASDRSQPESNQAIPEFSEITPPNAPDSDRQPATPKLGESISSAKRLPPPPAVDTPKPKPDIPDPADYPLSKVARQSGFDRQKLAQQKKSLPQSTEAETEITSPADTTTQSPQNTEVNIEAESDISELETAEVDRLAAKSSSPQLSQVREVTAYFENNWQPPENLKQGLEYRLVIAPDGSIQRVIPLGKAARIYLSQTKIPVNGESFISPVAKTQPATIRLLLNPDGKVQAFTE